MLLGTFLGNLFTGQGKIRIGKGQLEQVKSFNAAKPLAYFELQKWAYILCCLLKKYFF